MAFDSVCWLFQSARATSSSVFARALTFSERSVDEAQPNANTMVAARSVKGSVKTVCRLLCTHEVYEFVGDSARANAGNVALIGVSDGLRGVDLVGIGVHT